MLWKPAAGVCRRTIAAPREGHIEAFIGRADEQHARCRVICRLGAFPVPRQQFTQGAESRQWSPLRVHRPRCDPADRPGRHPVAGKLPLVEPGSVTDHGSCVTGTGPGSVATSVGWQGQQMKLDRTIDDRGIEELLICEVRRGSSSNLQSCDASKPTFPNDGSWPVAEIRCKTTLLMLNVAQRRSRQVRRRDQT